jgi:hypothetical protein
MSRLVVVVRESTGGEAGGDDEYRKHGAAIAAAARAVERNARSQCAKLLVNWINSSIRQLTLVRRTDT